MICLPRRFFMKLIWVISERLKPTILKILKALNFLINENCNLAKFSKIKIQTLRKNAENFSTKALAIKLCYLQIDEVHWLMKGWSSVHLKFILRLMSWVLTVHHICLTERTTVHHFCLTKRTTVHHFCLTKSQMNKRPHAASA